MVEGVGGNLLLQQNDSFLIWNDTKRPFDNAFPKKSTHMNVKKGVDFQQHFKSNYTTDL